MQRNKQIWSMLFRYFMRGLLLVAPFVLTVYIILLALNFIDSLIRIRIPGLGMTILLVSITFFGYLGSTLLVRSIFELTESFIIKLPFVSTIYSSFKELTSAFISKEKRFNQPVLVTINREAHLHKIGFITRQDLNSIDLPGSMAVYVPHSYNFSGDLFILPKQSIAPLKIAGTEAMKFIISGGVTGVHSADLAEEVPETH